MNRLNILEMPPIRKGPGGTLPREIIVLGWGMQLARDQLPIYSFDEGT